MSLTVLITRPIFQATSLAKALDKAGFTSIATPMIQFVAPPNEEYLQQVIINAYQFDLLIFVSPNAAQFFLNYCAKWAKQIDLSNLKSAAVGASTAAVLKKAGFKQPIYPTIANSIELLKLPLLNKVEQKHVAIFAGLAGNTLLANTLTQRGANVTMAYTHQTQCPNYDKNTLLQQWTPVDIIICTSLAILRNLRTIIEVCGCLELLKKPLLVISANMGLAAHTLGFKGDIIKANGAENTRITTALMKWKNQRSKGKIS